MQQTTKLISTSFYFLNIVVRFFLVRKKLHVIVKKNADRKCRIPSFFSLNARVFTLFCNSMHQHHRRKFIDFGNVHFSPIINSRNLNYLIMYTFGWVWHIYHIRCFIHSQCTRYSPFSSFARHNSDIPNLFFSVCVSFCFRFFGFAKNWR